MLNTPFPLFRKYELGDMLLLFLQDGEQLAWTLIPVGSEDRIPLHRDNLRDTVAVRNFAKVQGGDYKACRLESMAQYHLKGDPFPNDYSAGETLRSVNCDQMKFSRIEAVENRITVVFEGIEVNGELSGNNVTVNGVKVKNATGTWTADGKNGNISLNLKISARIFQPLLVR